ncbi:hypothetical protein GY631_6400 [Trichophyton interdigitale]|nr:hypothetical protein GY631_6400 [Trichophyton interdigitale]
MFRAGELHEQVRVWVAVQGSVCRSQPNPYVGIVDVSLPSLHDIGGSRKVFPERARQIQELALSEAQRPVSPLEDDSIPSAGYRQLQWHVAVAVPLEVSVIEARIRRRCGASSTSNSSTSTSTSKRRRRRVEPPGDSAVVSEKASRQDDRPLGLEAGLTEGRNAVCGQRVEGEVPKRSSARHRRSKGRGRKRSYAAQPAPDDQDSIAAAAAAGAAVVGAGAALSPASERRTD